MQKIFLLLLLAGGLQAAASNNNDGDTDGDGLRDQWEQGFGLNPLSAADALADPDQDGRDNLTEYHHNSNPWLADTGLTPNYYLYWDGFVNEWHDYSPLNTWQPHATVTGPILNDVQADIQTTAPVYQGQYALSVHPERWLFLNLWNENIDLGPFEYLEFYIHGGTSGGQNLNLSGFASSYLDHQMLTPLAIQDYIEGGSVAANEWRRVLIPLQDLGSSDNVISRLAVGWPLSGAQAQYFIDSIRLIPKPEPALATVSIDLNSTLATVNKDLYGSNGGYWANNMHLNGMAELVQQAGISQVRYPGGSVSDLFHFRDYLEPDAKEWITTPDEFIQFTQAAATEAMITTNFGTGTAAEAADFVKYMTVDNQVPVGLWEVGNEIYGDWTPTWSHDGALYMLGDAEHDGANDYCQAMKRVDATIQVGMVGTTKASVSNGYVENALQNMSNCFDYYIFHYYPFGSDDYNYYSLLMSPHADLALVVNNIRALTQQYPNSSQLKLAMTEYNSYADGVKHLADEVVNMLFLADTLGIAAELGVNKANHWFIGGTPEHQAYNFLTEYPNYQRSPSYFVFPLLKELVGTMHQVTTNVARSNIAVYAATQADGDIVIIAVNKSPEAVDVNVELLGLNQNATVQLNQVAGNALNATTVSYNGVASPPVDLNTVPSTSIPLNGQQFSYRLTPYSITQFTVTPSDTLQTIAAPRQALAACLRRRTERASVNHRAANANYANQCRRRFNARATGVSK